MASGAPHTDGAASAAYPELGAGADKAIMAMIEKSLLPRSIGEIFEGEEMLCERFFAKHISDVASIESGALLLSLGAMSAIFNSTVSAWFPDVPRDSTDLSGKQGKLFAVGIHAVVTQPSGRGKEDVGYVDKRALQLLLLFFVRRRRARRDCAPGDGH